MKNRFVGDIIIVYPDGYEEKSRIKEHRRKGERNFLDIVARAIMEMLVHSPQLGKCEVKYRGDFQDKIANFMEKLKKQKEPLAVLPDDRIFVANKKMKEK